MMSLRGPWLSLLIVSALTPRPAAGGAVGRPPAADGPALEFFEKEVRPVLATRCQGCHGPEKQKGGLRLDSRRAALAGGDSGAAVVPGDPGASPLVDAINYGASVQMPPKSKLPPAEVASLTRWVAMGAPWPEADRPKQDGATDAAAAVAWKRRWEHWSFLPVRPIEPPAADGGGWARDPIDRFLLAELKAAGLRPAPDADRRAWLRRVTFDLIGLPPRPEEVEAFVVDAAADADARAVDRLLASPRYGERWARHWLDLVRYAETSGHEFDYDIPDAWRYRDYVVRAFNDDLPYDRFVVEHIAGDLLPDPRRGPAGGNESILATGFYFLGEGNHSPVDLREDEAMRIDNQVDVVGKAFLGLTLACARCHDHKFDPITAKDYYALSGFLKSSRFQHAFLDPPGKASEVGAIKDELTAAVRRRGDLPGAAPADDDGSTLFEGFDGPAYEGWTVLGEAFGAGPSRAGDFRVVGDRPAAVPVPPGRAHSGLTSDRLRGVLRSRSFTIDRPYLHYRAEGRSGRINLVVDGFEKIRAPIYGGLALAVDSPDRTRWYTMDVSMWRGHRAFVELADGATVDYTTGKVAYLDGDGFLAVDEIRASDRPEPPGGPPAEAGPPVPLDGPDLGPILARFREAESRIAPPSLAPAIADGTEEDARLLVRGNPKTPGEVVPRRFLEVLGGADSSPPRPGGGSGRLDLARRIVDPANPLADRVLVNRLWKHHFGEGLVRSPDDFGAMGQAPSHPALLDWLAADFVRGGRSIKRMHRQMVLSHAYRMASAADAGADRADPTNRLLHRMNVRRLEAEAIRDAMLSVSGRLDPSPGGPGVPTHLTPFMDGRGRPAGSGPLDGAGRRSLYLSVRRNFLSPLLLAFDFPAPSASMGRRNVSNVPAQALTLLNDPFILDQARAWADRTRARSPSPEARVDDLYRTAFGRPPTDRERAESLAFVRSEGETPAGGDDPQAWADLCHVLMNTKEFIFIP